MSSSRETFVDWCYSQIGKPVFWCAKGDYCIDGDDEKIILPGKHYAFDCSGLVGCGLIEAKGLDYRATWNALRFFNDLPPVDADKRQPGDLILYGLSDVTINHVAIVGRDGHFISADGASSLQRRKSDPKKPPLTDDTRRAMTLRAIEESFREGNIVRLHHWPGPRHAFRAFRRNTIVEDLPPVPR